jgi:hypothetical protein
MTGQDPVSHVLPGKTRGRVLSARLCTSKAAVRRRVFLIAGLCAAVSLALLVEAGAQEATPPANLAADGPVVAPDSVAFGGTYAEWAARFAQWNYSFPFDNHPLNQDSALACGVGQHGEVFFLGSVVAPGDDMTIERACTVPADRALFVSVVFLGCSTLEADYCGTAEEELGDTAARWVDKTTSVSASLDGVEIPDLERYRVATEAFSIIVPVASPGVPAGIGMAVSDGYYLLIPPLASGEHTLHWVYNNTDMPGPHDVTYHLTVIP